ncbi:toll/interleukin-1 receptor domain-containing protein [Streptomyces sp. NPDC005435]|uniref:tetratricopeptide repeat protein n=1 Tax=Streptomyces sp. NPDC005435 TaxID=3154464 RepID=UPI003451E7DF
MDEYDVFLSFGGHDRLMAERTAKELHARGLRVFLDEGIRTGQGVTAAIERALAASRLLLVYFSAGYPIRYACQFELTAALLAGQREGNPAGRIVVINPEPDEDHLFPVELADASFARAPKYGDKAAYAALEAAIRERLRSVRGTIGEPRFTERPRWIANRVAGEYGFVGRYREQWQLHSRLREAGYPLVRQVTSGPVVALLGVAGAGKSALAAAYSWQFGAAYPGGVHWLDLSGTTRSDMTDRYHAEVRRIARTLQAGPDTGRADAAELTAAVANRLHTAREAALWVVDDLPPGLEWREVEPLLLPAEPWLHTVLISRHGPYAETMPTVELGPMSAEDARALLLRYRPVDTEDEARALDVLVDRLGGHAMGLRLTGRRLRDRQGLLSVAGQVRHLADEPGALDAATVLVRESFRTLTERQRLVLQLTEVCAGASLPARFIADVVTEVRPAGDDPGDALTGLRDLMLAARTEDRWEFHSIVREAARRFLPPVVPPSLLARTAAGLLLRQAESPGGVPEELMPHAAALARRSDVPAGTAHTLHRVLSVFHEDRGEPVAAARHWDLALASAMGTAPELLRAAQAHLDAGGYERAGHYAGLARRAAPAGSPAGTAAVTVLAQALDSLGRIKAADPCWDTVRAALPPLSDVRPAGTGTAGDGQAVDEATTELWLGYLKSRRLRGDMRTALTYAEALVALLSREPAETAGHRLQAARIELAVVQLSTNAQREARQTAETVRNWYREQGLPEHMHSVAAQSVLAQAWLTLHLLELGPDPANWREAAESLARLREQLRSRHGPLNGATLAADVEYGYALLCLGRPHKARTHLVETISRLDRRYGPRHPLTLRARLMLGRSHAQLREYRQAAELHEHAYDGLSATLGPRHPDTLHAQYGLGVALVLTGNRSRGRRMLREVRRTAPSSVGRKSDLYAQSVAATALFVLPSGLWRQVDRMTNDRPGPDDEP